jgi:hypothetical protein
MAYSKIYLTNGNYVKKAPVGFSWTVFFFGGIPCLFRQDWLIAILMIICNAITYGLAGVIFAFFYNKIYINNLINSGYKIRDLPPDVTEDTLRSYLGLINVPMENAPKAV